MREMLVEPFWGNTGPNTKLFVRGTQYAEAMKMVPEEKLLKLSQRQINGPAQAINVAPTLLNREYQDRGPRKVLLTDITY